MMLMMMMNIGYINPEQHTIIQAERWIEWIECEWRIVVVAVAADVADVSNDFCCVSIER